MWDEREGVTVYSPGEEGTGVRYAALGAVFSNCSKLAIRIRGAAAPSSGRCESEISPVIITRETSPPLMRTLTVSTMEARSPGVVEDSNGSILLLTVELDVVERMELVRSPPNEFMREGEGKGAAATPEKGDIPPASDAADVSLVRCCSRSLARGTSSGMTGL